MSDNENENVLDQAQVRDEELVSLPGDSSDEEEFSVRPHQVQ